MARGYFGYCKYNSTSPSQADLRSKTKVLNVYLSFEDALKLNFAMQKCLLQLASSNHRGGKGKSKGLSLAVCLGRPAIMVTEFPRD